jgi:hypothetical protein
MRTDLSGKVQRVTNFKNSPGIAERMSTAAAAKKALIEKSRSVKVDPTDPAFVERQAARQATALARAERQGASKVAKAQAAAERKAAKETAEAERKAAKEAAEALALSEKEKLLAEKVLTAEQIRAIEAERKAARYAKYAARNTRQR